MLDKIFGEGRRAPEDEAPNGGITGRLGALFACPSSVRIALDGLARFELRRG